MSDGKYKIISVIVLILSVSVVIWFSMSYRLSSYSDAILPIVTIFYAYFTLEILRNTMMQRPRPLPDPSIVISTELDDEFTNKYRGLIKDNYFIKSRNEYLDNTGDGFRNYLFLKINNIGDKHALNVSCSLEYIKKYTDQGSPEKINKDIVLGTIKSEKNNLILFDIFDKPSEDDSVRITKCEISFSDAFLINNKKKSEKKCFPNIKANFHGSFQFIKYKNYGQ